MNDDLLFGKIHIFGIQFILQIHIRIIVIEGIKRRGYWVNVEFILYFKDFDVEHELFEFEKFCFILLLILC